MYDWSKSMLSKREISSANVALHNVFKPHILPACVTHLFGHHSTNFYYSLTEENTFSYHNYKNKRYSLIYKELK